MRVTQRGRGLADPVGCLVCTGAMTSLRRASASSCWIPIPLLQPLCECQGCAHTLLLLSVL